MRSSRRDFVRQSLAAAGAAALTPAQCSRPRNPMDLPNNATTVAQFEPAYLHQERQGKLKAVEADLWEIFRSCNCCPRSCRTDRIKGDKGVCSSTARLKVYAADPHFGEERPLVGRGGSGTVVFSDCSLLCCFCQNWQINHRGDGSYIRHDELARIMLNLQARGCHNINLVTPTHVVPHIIKGLRIAIAGGLRLPLVYNTGGYDSLEVIRQLDGIVDIYLPDFKYQDRAMAAKYSSGAEDYPEVAAAVIREMHRQVGLLQVDEKGVAQRGLIIRHLVMPNNIAGTDRFARWVAQELSPRTSVNIMAQYRPMHKAFDYPDIARRITAAEWERALAWAREAGLTNLVHA